VPLLPPELTYPFRSHVERDAARDRLVLRDAHIAIHRGTRKQAGYGMVPRRTGRLSERDQRSCGSSTAARLTLGVAVR